MTLTFNLPENVSNGTSPPQGQQLYQIVCIIVQIMVRTNPDGRIHRTKIVTTMSRLPASGFDKTHHAETVQRRGVGGANISEESSLRIKKKILRKYF